MEIDKIYKPLDFTTEEFENKLYGTYSIVKKYNSDDVEGLEEKHKKAISLFIELLGEACYEGLYCDKYLRFIEKEFGLKWEDIINE